jgi:hypothetical protein
MNNINLNRALIPLSLLAASSAWAQSDANPPNGFVMKPEAPVWRASLDYRAGFNIKANFKDVGRYAAVTIPGAATGGVNHYYDDGYNLVDSTGNNHFGTAATWNWGYQNAGQYDGSGSGSIAMHSSSSQGISSNGRDNDPVSGMELAFSRSLEQHEHWSLGVKAAFSYSYLDIKDSHALGTPTTRLTDTYDLGGTTPPTAPYSGNYAGPGILLSDSPTRSYQTVTEPVTGSRDLTAHVFGFHLGPYIEVPLTKSLSMLFDGGVALAVVSSEYSFNETIATPDAGSFTARGSHTDSEFLVGGYVGASLAWNFSENWALFGGAEWQTVGSHTNNPQVTGAGKAELNLENAVFVKAGVTWTF